MNTEYIVYTDGASKGNPGPGGWGAVVIGPANVYELGGREPHTTNNRMELLGVISALECVIAKGGKSATIFTDSRYVINGITKWVFGWQKNNWQTASRQPVLNSDVWKHLAILAHRSSLELKWNYVGGHIGIAGNERVDEIASGMALGKQIALYQGPRSGYVLDITNQPASQKLQIKKADSKNHSKTRAYSYVSEVEGVVQTHGSWAECEARVKGKRARFKKAISAQDEMKIRKEFSK